MSPEQSRYIPEIALTRLRLTELLLEHYLDEKPEALEHLDFAISEFHEMKMQPSPERALRHKEILGCRLPSEDDECKPSHGCPYSSSPV
jgi:hypothetical protein